MDAYRWLVKGDGRNPLSYLSVLTGLLVLRLPAVATRLCRR